MHFENYLKKLIKESGLSYRKLGHLAKVDYTYISKIVTGKSNPPSPEILERLSRYLPASYEELMFKAGYINSIKETASDYDTRRIITLPVLSHLPCSEDTIPEELISKDKIVKYLDLPTELAANASFILKVCEDSMEGIGIHGGDYLAVRKQDNPENGATTLILKDGKMLIRRLYTTGNKIFLEPKCSLYSSPLALEQLNIIGIVVLVIRKL